MTKKLTILALASILACTAVSLLADSPAPGSATVKTPDEASRIEALLAMAPEERRAALKELSPEERRGLWFRLKRTQAERRSSERATYRDLVPTERPAAVTPSSEPAEKARHDDGTDRPSNKFMGTIQYDDGTGSTTFGGGAIIGNRFDTHTGGVQVTASGTVDTIVAVVAQGPAFTTSSAGFVLLGPQTGGGGAMAIFSSFTGATGATDTVTFNSLGVSYTGNSFFVLFGDFANSYVPVFDSGTVNGQGHHGVVGYTGGMGPNITGTFNFGGALNALVRVTGNVLPVELMSFDVE